MSRQSDSRSVSGQCRWFPAAAAAATTATTAARDPSTCSSDTRDVFIRSTRLGPATERGSVEITVERVLGDPATERLRPPKTPREQDKARLLSAVGPRPHRRWQQRKPAELTKEGTVNLLSPPLNQQHRKDCTPDMKLCAETDCLQSPGQKVLTSRFAVGNREVVLEALKLRSHSAPRRQEVRVQLLDQTGPDSSRGAPGLRNTSSHDRVPGLGNSSSHDAAGVSVTHTPGLPSDESNKVAPVVKNVTEPHVFNLADGYYQLLQEERERGWSLSQQMLRLLENTNNLQLQIGAGHHTLMTSDPLGPSDHSAADQGAGWTTHQDTAANISIGEQHHTSPAAPTVTSPGPTVSPHQDLLTGGTRNNGAAPSVSRTTHPEEESGGVQPMTNQDTAVAPGSQIMDEMQSLRSEMRMLLKLQRERKDTQPSHINRSEQAPSTRHQRTPRVFSVLEDAGEVLCQVQRRKRILEENLQALQRCSSGVALEGQLEALASNRDGQELLRIQETVDTCIQMVSRDIKAEILSSETTGHKPSKKKDAAVPSQPRCLSSFAHRKRGKPVSVLSMASRGMAASSKAQQTDLESSIHVQWDSEQQLAHLYGRAQYEGARRTLKTTPYLHFSTQGCSLSRRPRPRLVESIRGVKMKSSKTQTSLAPPLILHPQAMPPKRHLGLRSALVTSADPPPMAIPLGCSRVKSSTRCPQRPQEVTSTKAKAALTASGVTVAEWQPQAAEEPGPSAPVDAGKSSEEEKEKEKGEMVFPAGDVLSTDIAQVAMLSSCSGPTASPAGNMMEEEKEEEEKQEEEVVQVAGGPLQPPVQYEGPTFPPQASRILPVQDQTPIRTAVPLKDPLEEQLVEWVEQQLMFRVISRKHQQTPADPTNYHDTDQSQREEQPETSDTGGPQLLVDSDLVRQLVEEVLAEQITLILGHKDAPERGHGAEPEVGSGLEKATSGAELEVLVLPPVPDSLISTPAPSPPASPAPPSRESPPLATPIPSEPSRSMTEEPVLAEGPLATPTLSPDPNHIPASPIDACQAPPTLSPGDGELALLEEPQDGHLDAVAALLLKGEDHVAPPSPTPAAPCPPSCPSLAGEEAPGSDSRSGSSCSSSEKSSSSCSLQTEAAVRHISEGELLLSHQATITEGELHCSFSSSLQEEMDFDPPSEGQVRGHDLPLRLLSKMELGVEQRGERPQPEGAWGGVGKQEEEDLSTGEVRGHAVKPDVDATAAAGHAPSSCGECTDISLEAADHSSTTAADPVEELMSNMTSDPQTTLH